jgi:hypothetical protein
MTPSRVGLNKEFDQALVFVRNRAGSRPG